MRRDPHGCAQLPVACTKLRVERESNTPLSVVSDRRELSLLYSTAERRDRSAIWWLHRSVDAIGKRYTRGLDLVDRGSHGSSPATKGYLFADRPSWSSPAWTDCDVHKLCFRRAQVVYRSMVTGYRPKSVVRVDPDTRARSRCQLARGYLCVLLSQDRNV